MAKEYEIHIVPTERVIIRLTNGIEDTVDAQTVYEPSDIEKGYLLLKKDGNVVGRYRIRDVSNWRAGHVGANK